MNKNNLIIVSGPTATGKTSVSIKFAKKLKAPIVNFDSLLFYKELTVGTAKPTLEEREGVEHHLIDIVSAKNPINAAMYVKQAGPLLDKLFEKHSHVFLVGGSGFYLRALLKGMYESPLTPNDIIKRSEELYENEGIKPFWDILEKCDEKTYNKLHENDHYRIRRAVEHFWTNGTPFSYVKDRLESDKRDSQKKWKEFHFYLDIPKPEHQKIIEKRTEQMIQNGLIEEVQSLLKAGFTGEEKPLSSIGYKETLQYLNGVFDSLESYKERIVISTRQLAKAQRTWFNKVNDKISLSPFDDLANIQKIIRPE